MTAGTKLRERDVFLLKAMTDDLTLLGFPLSRNKTFTKCEIFLPDDSARPIGEAVSFVERGYDEGAPGESIRFYSDATKTTELLRITSRRRLARAPGQRRTLSGVLHALVSDPTYDVTEADGTRIGVIHKIIGERQYHVSATSESEPLIVIQEREVSTMKGWLLSDRPFASDRFAFWCGDRRLGWHEPRPSRTDSIVDMTLDPGHIVDRRLGLAVSCLDVLRPRNEG